MIVFYYHSLMAYYTVPLCTFIMGVLGIMPCLVLGLEHIYFVCFKCILLVIVANIVAFFLICLSIDFSTKVVVV